MNVSIKNILMFLVYKKKKKNIYNKIKLFVINYKYFFFIFIEK